MLMREFKKEETPYGAIVASPMPDEDDLAAFYADIYYQENTAESYLHSYSDEELAHRRLRADLMLYAVEKASPSKDKKRSFLEIGCGEGFVLKAAYEKGYSITGVDFSEFGLRKVHPELVNKVEFGDAYKILNKLFVKKNRFTFCVLQNVIEHVIEPATLMHKIKAILKPEGIVAVTVPNDYSRLQKKVIEIGLVDKEFWFLPPQHLHYFNVDNFKAFAEYCEYEILDEYADFPIDFFLFHPSSNYVMKPEQGKPAHIARLNLDLLLAERGMGSYHRLCQALTDCGVGRNVTVLMRPMASKK